MIDYKKIIEEEMIRRAEIKNGLAKFFLSDGENTVINFDCTKKDIPSKLFKSDPVFYERLQDEIFDEIHPY